MGCGKKVLCVFCCEGRVGAEGKATGPEGIELQQESLHKEQLNVVVSFFPRSPGNPLPALPSCLRARTGIMERYLPHSCLEMQAASCRLPLLMEARNWTEDRCLLLAHRQLTSSLASVPAPSGLRQPHALYLFVSFFKGPSPP